MKQEEKYLLFKDLISRLPYGVKCIEITPFEEFKDKNLWEIDRIRKDTIMFGLSNCYICYGHYIDIHNIKPYLFPLSSMTDEQIMQSPKSIHVCDLENLRYNNELTELNGTDLIDLIDWLNKNHFDYRGLIEKGLALDATGKNIY